MKVTLHFDLTKKEELARYNAACSAMDVVAKIAGFEKWLKGEAMMGGMSESRKEVLESVVNRFDDLIKG